LRFIPLFSSQKTRSVTLLALAVASLIAGPRAGLAAGTLAGTTINNTATATYTDSNGKPVVVNSNTLAITVDEILNVKVVASDPGNVIATAGATNVVMTFNVTNTGNGKEAMKLTPVTAIAGDQFDPTATSVVLDTNNNGIYDPGVDTVYTPGTNDPVLNADASIKVFVLSTIPGGVVNGNQGQLNLTAQDVLGTGAPGTVFAGKGNGGVDAVVGATGATSTDKNFYLIQQASVSFVKSAVIADPFGGTTPVPGATITYSLVATVNGAGALSGIVITDAIPASTTYEAGTMTLQGTALTDAVDAVDAASFTGSGISVGLGTVPAGQTRTVTFKVKIN
jgi:uncharacterized repeat protein (TIGR01451 family)